jgi:hypothetical protein
VWGGLRGVERFVWRKLSGRMLWRLASAFAIMVLVLVVEAVGGTDSDTNTGVGACPECGQILPWVMGF